MCPVTTAIYAAGGGACPTPSAISNRPGNHTTSADANDISLNDWLLRAIDRELRSAGRKG